MTRTRPMGSLRRITSLLAAGLLAGTTPLAHAQNPLVTGKKITLPPLGVQQNVGSLPMNLVASPDGKYAISTDMGFRQSLWSIRTSDGVGVFHLDFPGGAGLPAIGAPAVSNGLYYGLAFAADGTLYAAQGANDSIAVIRLAADGTLVPLRTILTKKGDFPSGLALDNRGFLYVANNDTGLPNVPTSIAIYNTSTGLEVGRFTFNASFFGTPNFPLAIATLADGSKTYVASQRDGAVYVLNTSNPAAPAALGAIPTGAHPLALLLSKSPNRLFVANAHSDTISVINTANDNILQTILLRPDNAQGLAGVTPTNLTESPDGKTLYATLGDMNALAVIALPQNKLTGYIPTGWYPTGVVATSLKKLLVANAKGVKTRYPNPGYVLSSFNANPQYDLNQIEGTVQTFGVPSSVLLKQYTQQVLDNNRITSPVFLGPNPLSGIGLQAGKIKHVIYIVRENRTYDQVFGDVATGNGDPTLTLFGNDVTPNAHALAQRFVLLDNFYVCGEASGDGWPWSTQGMANEYVIKNLPYNYSGRGRNYDFEGQDNGYLTGGHPAKDPDGNTLSAALPGGAPTIPDVAEAPAGHIWDVVERGGLSFRNYGFFYSFGVVQNGQTVIPDNYPSSVGLREAGHDLAGLSDFDYRRYDNDYPDSDAPKIANQQTGNPDCLYSRTSYGKYSMPSRFSEWSREFQEMLAKDPTGNAVPAFVTVRFNHDHTQGFTPGKHSPRSEVADNDYAVGQLVEAISKSPIWKNTAIFVVEDDAQDGPDHVDAHRSPCLVISPWITKSSVDHTFYNTDSVLRTMELLLGLPPMSQYDAVANPILDWDSSASNDLPYSAILPAVQIICEKNPALQGLKPGTTQYKLAMQALKMDFDHPDSANPRLLNEMLWKSVKGFESKMPEPKHTLIAWANTQEKKLAASRSGKGVNTKKSARRDDDD